MKPSNNMQHIVGKLAVKYGFNLDADYGHLMLAKPHYSNLTIEKHGPNMVAVMYFRGDDPMQYLCDPMFRFWMYDIKAGPDKGKQNWFPIESRMAIGHKVPTVRFAQPEEDDKFDGDWGFYPVLQTDAAHFAQKWARDIKGEENWLGDARVVSNWSVSPELGVVIHPGTRETEYVRRANDKPYTLDLMREYLGDGSMTPIRTILGNQYQMWANEDAEYLGYDPNYQAARMARHDHFAQTLLGPVMILPSAWMRH